MTQIEREAVLAIDPKRVVYPIASFPKRFARQIQAQLVAGLITDAQCRIVWRQVWRFRRQISASHLVREAQRHGAHEQLREYVPDCQIPSLPGRTPPHIDVDATLEG